jgi:putative transposase
MNHDQTQHRKKVKHYDHPGHIRELTFSCYQRRPLLTNDLWRRMLSTAIDRAVERHGYGIAALIYMPEHVHLIVWPRAGASGVSDLLLAIKRPFALRIKQLLAQGGSPLLEQLTIRQRPGISTFRFWQEGPGYDRNLTEPKTALAAIEYVHLNPVRRGLVKRAIDWPWSSARWYVDPSSPNEEHLPKIDRLPPEWAD